MPWSARYLMNLQARGRPLPTGRPEDLLERAIEQLSLPDVEQAIHAGANPDGMGANALHLALDVAERRGEPLREGSRLASLVITLLRCRTRLDQVDRRTQLTVPERLLAMPSTSAVGWAMAHLPQHVLSAPPGRRPPLATLVAHGTAETVALFPVQHPHWGWREGAGPTLAERWAQRQADGAVPPRRRLSP